MDEEVFSSLQKLQKQVSEIAKIPQFPKVEIPQLPKIEMPKIPNVGDISPIHKVIYEIALGKFIETPIWTTMSQAIGIHLVYYRRCNA